MTNTIRVRSVANSNIREGEQGNAHFHSVSTVYPGGLGLGVIVVWFIVVFDHGSIVLQQIGRDILPVENHKPKT